MIALSWRDWNPLSLRSYSYAKFFPSFCRLLALKIFPPYHKWAAIILFIVRVPVLSEQMQVVHPRVYTAWRFLASTFLLDSLLAVRVSAIVTSRMSPLGTLATVIPMAKVKALMISNPIPSPTEKTMIPKQTAEIPSLWTNLLIYRASGVSSS